MTYDVEFSLPSDSEWHNFSRHETQEEAFQRMEGMNGRPKNMYNWRIVRVTREPVSVDKPLYTVTWKSANGETYGWDQEVPNTDVDTLQGALQIAEQLFERGALDVTIKDERRVQENARIWYRNHIQEIGKMADGTNLYHTIRSAGPSVSDDEVEIKGGIETVTRDEMRIFQDRVRRLMFSVPVGGYLYDEEKYNPKIMQDWQRGGLSRITAFLHMPDDEAKKVWQTLIDQERTGQ